ncbi:MAG: DUF4331 family protein [Candidatus Sericytochromatia bacterium]|nr:DUF4331 family protein [Candidatus Sericytochromatia bacterium]
MRQHALPVVLAGVTIAGFAALRAQAFDAFDGPVASSQRETDLVDLYVFREAEQSDAAVVPNDIDAIMTVAPGTTLNGVPTFPTNTRYNLHISRVTGGPTTTPAGTADLTLSVNFGAVSGTQQAMRITAIQHAAPAATASVTVNTDGEPLLTSPPAGTGALVHTAEITLGSQAKVSFKAFAGLREDPSFHDRARFLSILDSLEAGGAAPAPFASPGLGTDAAAGRNVLAIALSLPPNLLKGSVNTTVFDTWQTIEVAR